MLGTPRPSPKPPRERYIYYPDTSPVPEGVAVNVRGRSYKILANVEITDANASGVIFAHGSRFGGHTLFIKDRKLHYVYNFLGIRPEQQFVSTGGSSPASTPSGWSSSERARASMANPWARPKLYVNDKVVAEGPMKTQAGKFTLSGDGLCVGFDSGDAVSQEYTSPGKFKGGTILGVGVTVEKTQYLDLQKEARRALLESVEVWLLGSTVCKWAGGSSPALFLLDHHPNPLIIPFNTLLTQTLLTPKRRATSALVAQVPSASSCSY